MSVNVSFFSVSLSSDVFFFLRNKARRTAHFQLQFTALTPTPFFFLTTALWTLLCLCQTLLCNNPNIPPVIIITFLIPTKVPPFLLFMLQLCFIVGHFFYLSWINIKYFPLYPPSSLSPPPSVPSLPPTPASNWLSLPFPFSLSQSVWKGTAFCDSPVKTDVHHQQQQLSQTSLHLVGSAFLDCKWAREMWTSLYGQCFFLLKEVLRIATVE